MSTDASKPNTFFMDGKEIDIRPGETIFRAGRRHDIRVPHLCYTPKPGYRPDGNCRVCMVEIEGERVLAASRLRTPTPGMKVKTPTARKNRAQMVAELLLTTVRASSWNTIRRQRAEDDRQPHEGLWAASRHERLAPDRSHPAMGG